MSYLLSGGTLCHEEGIEAGDLLLDNDKIVANESPGRREANNEVVDARGCYVLPGLIDVHVHLDDRIGPFQLADDTASGSRAALLNGLTTLAGFITQSRGERLSETIARARQKAIGRSHCDYLWHLTPTVFDKPGWHEIMAMAEKGWKTFKFYTTYRESGIYCSYQRLEEVMNRLRPAGATILVHAEDDDALKRVRSGSLPLADAFSHAIMRPPAAETKAAVKLLELAEKNDARIHLVHLSSVATVEAVARASRRMKVSGETAPHYLFLDETWLKRPDGHRWLCTPPLRDEGTVLQLREMAREGFFDLFATDHCAFSRQDKDARSDDIRQVPKGIAGIGALLHLVYKLLLDLRSRGLTEISRRLAANPARLLGLFPRKGTLRPGADADIVVLDPGGEEQPIVSSFSHCYETYPGFTSPLKIRHLFLRGQWLIRDNVFVGENKPRGICLCPE